jgi:hypothetical protein
MTPLQKNEIDLGVSRRALSLARMIDRLESGKFVITLIKPEGEAERWAVEISQSVTLQKKELVQEATQTPPPA